MNKVDILWIFVDIRGYFEEKFAYSKIIRTFVFQHRGVEQLVARRAHNPEAGGSSPSPATNLPQLLVNQGIAAKLLKMLRQICAKKSRSDPVLVKPLGSSKISPTKNVFKSPHDGFLTNGFQPHVESVPVESGPG